MKKSQRGFTLIELLTVLAILGILMAVVIIALNSSRGGGNDAKTKSQMGSVRSAAEAYSGLNGNYGTAANCSVGMFANSSSGMSLALNLSNYPSGTTLDCGSVPSAYSVAIKLGSGYWCVDSTGGARSKTKAGVSYSALSGTVAVPNATAAHSIPGSTVCN